MSYIYFHGKIHDCSRVPVLNRAKKQTCWQPKLGLAGCYACLCSAIRVKFYAVVFVWLQFLDYIRIQYSWNGWHETAKGSNHIFLKYWRQRVVSDSLALREGSSFILIRCKLYVYVYVLWSFIQYRGLPVWSNLRGPTTMVAQGSENTSSARHA